MSAPPPVPPPSPTGWVSIVKGMSLTNAAVVLVLVVALVPAYAAYRLLTDPTLLDRFLSSYTVTDTDSPCRVIKARQRGEQFTWAITTGFAFGGQSRWSVGVTQNTEPTPEEIKSNCAVLSAIVDWMHGDKPMTEFHLEEQEGEP